MFQQGDEGSREPILDETLPDLASPDIRARWIINQNKCSCLARKKKEIFKETSRELGLTDLRYEHVDEDTY